MHGQKMPCKAEYHSSGTSSAQTRNPKGSWARDLFDHCWRQLRRPYATRLSSFDSVPSQEGQTKMNCSKRARSFGIVRRCFMVSPQEGHIRTRVLSGPSGEHSMAAIEGGYCIAQLH